jgi:hypothetical protein
MVRCGAHSCTLDIHVPFADAVAAAGAGVEVAAEDEISCCLRGGWVSFCFVFGFFVNWMSWGERGWIGEYVHQSRA